MADFEGQPIPELAKLSVLAAADDGEEENDTTWYPNGEATNKIYAGKFGGAPYVGAFRFKQAFIPNNAKIAKAVLRLRLNGQISNPANLKVRAVKEPSPNTFAGDGSDRPSTRTLTTAAVDWDFAQAPGTGWNVTGNWIASPDIKAVIEEVLALEEFDGKAIIITLEPDVDCPDNKLAPFYDSNEGQGFAAELRLEFAPRV